MKNFVADYYKNGYNCCEAVIMAADKKYKLGVSKDVLYSANLINNGMGVGSLCSAIIGGVMVIGLVFGRQNTIQDSQLGQLRMQFLDCVNCELKSINCSQICKTPLARDNCIEVISIIAGILDKIISKYKI